MVEFLTGVNGEILRWARQRYNMSEEEAAYSIGIDIERYINWEKGIDFPTYAMLKKSGNLFKKPTAIFFFPEPPSLPDIKADLRTLPNSISNTFSKNVIRQFELAQVYQLNLKELYGDKISLIQRIRSENVNISELCDEIRTELAFPIAAQKARRSDKVVFEIFREKLYELGVYVFKDAFGDDNISGLCLYDEKFPVIVINNSMSFARQNFTLFHELYHLISNTSGAEIIRDSFYLELSSEQANAEKRCDEFANEFLVPTEDFILELAKEPLSERRIAELAKIYAVSKEAIMYKLYVLGKITADDYNQLKEFFYGDALRNDRKKEGEKSSGNHYFTKLAYLGHQYAGAVFKEYFSGRISSYRASEMLNSKVDHLPKLESAFFRGIK